LTCSDAGSVIQNIAQDFQQEFEDTFYDNFMLRSVAPIQAAIPEYVILNNYSAAPVDDLQRELSKLLYLAKINVTYDMLYEGNLISASINSLNFTIGGGTWGDSTFSLSWNVNHTLALAGNTTVFNGYLVLNGDIITRKIDVLFAGNFFSEDPKFDYKFFPSAQQMQLTHAFNKSITDAWSTAHFRKTLLSNCTTGTELAEKLKNATFVQNYTYFCGSGQEISVKFTKASFSELVFHQNEDTFNSIANITFTGRATGDTASESFTIASNVAAAKKGYKFINSSLVLGTKIRQCVTANPQLLEQIMFDFALDFKNQKQTQFKAPLKFLS